MMVQNLAPIILFVYNRPWHTQQTLEALMANELADQSILYIYCDGPKKNASVEDLKNIKKVRTLIRKKEWCKEVVIIVRDQNLGLANSVIKGVTEIINKHGSIIVLEDDLITSPFFLTYCNEGLRMYKNSANVYSINSFQFPLKTEIIDTFLCPLATSTWGWATWKDKWNCFDTTIEHKKLIQANKFLSQRFNFANYDYVSMLDNHNSWGIKWYYSVFMNNGLGLFPTKTLVSNIGFDGSGVNCGNINFASEIENGKIELKRKNYINLNFYALLLDYFSEKEETVNVKNNDAYFKKIKFLIKKLIKSDA